MSINQEPAVDFPYFVKWSKEDNEYVATTPEFPSLSWLDPNEGEAVEGLKKLVAKVRKDLAS